MDFKEMYKSANDDIKGDRELINQIFEKAEKKRFTFPALTFSYAVAAVAAFVFFFSVYPKFNVTTEETDKVAVVTSTASPVTESVKESEIKISEPVKEAPAKTEVVYVGKPSGEITNNVESAPAPASEPIMDGIPAADETESIRVASVINVNTVMARRMMEEPIEETAMDNASSGGSASGGASTPAPSPEVTVTTSEKGGEVSEIIESEDFVKSQINGQTAVIIYNGSDYTAYISSEEEDITVFVTGGTEENLEEILNSIN